MAGGEARALYNAWRYGGHDPYRLYNLLDDNYRPMDVGGEPRRPLHPSRVRAFIYGCAKVAHEEAIKLSGGQVQRQVRG